MLAQTCLLIAWREQEIETEGKKFSVCHTMVDGLFAFLGQKTKIASRDALTWE